MAKRTKTSRQPKSNSKSTLLLDRYLKNRTSSRRIGLLVILLLIGVGSWYDYQQTPASQFQSVAYRVVHVVDGDTIDVRSDGKTLGPKIRCRLWGVDTPELAKDWADQPGQPFAQQAREYTLENCLDQVVRLDVEDARLYGKYGRLLAYVTLPDGQVLNEMLLTAGLARFEPRFAHSQYKRYQALEKQAKFNKVGMWTR